MATMSAALRQTPISSCGRSAEKSCRTRASERTYRQLSTHRIATAGPAGGGGGGGNKKAGDRRSGDGHHNGRRFEVAGRYRRATGRAGRGGVAAEIARIPRADRGRT